MENQEKPTTFGKHHLSRAEITAMVDDETLIRRALEHAERDGREEGLRAGESRGLALAITEILLPALGDREFDLARHLSELRVEPLLEMVRRSRTDCSMEFVLGDHLPAALSNSP